MGSPNSQGLHGTHYLPSRPAVLPSQPVTPWFTPLSTYQLNNPASLSGPHSVVIPALTPHLPVFPSQIPATSHILHCFPSILFHRSVPQSHAPFRSSLCIQCSLFLGHSHHSTSSPVSLGIGFHISTTGVPSSPLLYSYCVLLWHPHLISASHTP